MISWFIYTSPHPNINIIQTLVVAPYGLDMADAKTLTPYLKVCVYLPDKPTTVQVVQSLEHIKSLKMLADNGCNMFGCNCDYANDDYCYYSPVGTSGVVPQDGYCRLPTCRSTERCSSVTLNDRVC